MNVSNSRPSELTSACSLVLFVAKMVPKLAGVYPLARRYTSPHATFTTLLMSTGLTFGTITSLYGLNAGIIDQTQFSLLIAVVVLSAIVPTAIAQRFYHPADTSQIDLTAPVPPRRTCRYRDQVDPSGGIAPRIRPSEWGGGWGGSPGPTSARWRLRVQPGSEPSPAGFPGPAGDIVELETINYKRSHASRGAKPYASQRQRLDVSVLTGIVARVKRLLRGGSDGNEQLTAIVGMLLVIVLAVEGATLLNLRSLLTVHAFVGMLLIPIVALKLASTGGCFATTCAARSTCAAGLHNWFCVCSSRR